MFQDDLQAKVERLVLVSVPADRIAQALEIPLGEVQDRIRQVWQRLANEVHRLGTSDILGQYQLEVARSDHRYYLLYLMLQEGDNRADTVRLMQAESRHKMKLLAAVREAVFGEGGIVADVEPAHTDEPMEEHAQEEYDFEQLDIEKLRRVTGIG